MKPASNFLVFMFFVVRSLDDDFLFWHGIILQRKETKIGKLFSASSFQKFFGPRRACCHCDNVDTHGTAKRANNTKLSSCHLGFFASTGNFQTMMTNRKEALALAESGWRPCGKVVRDDDNCVDVTGRPAFSTSEYLQQLIVVQCFPWSPLQRRKCKAAKIVCRGSRAQCICNKPLFVTSTRTRFCAEERTIVQEWEQRTHL